MHTQVSIHRAHCAGCHASCTSSVPAVDPERCSRSNGKPAVGERAQGLRQFHPVHLQFNASCLVISRAGCWHPAFRAPSRPAPSAKIEDTLKCWPSIEYVKPPLICSSRTISSVQVTPAACACLPEQIRAIPSIGSFAAQLHAPAPQIAIAQQPPQFTQIARRPIRKLRYRRTQPPHRSAGLYPERPSLTRSCGTSRRSR